MGLLDIGESDDGEEDPTPFTVTVLTAWNGGDGRTCPLRIATGIFYGDDLSDITERAIQGAMRTLARADGRECILAEVVSLVEGAHDNLAVMPDDTEGEELPHAQIAATSSENT